MVQSSEPVILPSAFKWGINEPDIRHAYNNFIDVFQQDDEMIMYVGADRAGNLLEIGVSYRKARPAIAHAMKARDKYLRLLGER